MMVFVTKYMFPVGIVTARAEAWSWPLVWEWATETWKW